MLLTREEYYQDVSRHRRDMAIDVNPIKLDQIRPPIVYFYTLS